MQKENNQNVSKNKSVAAWYDPFISVFVVCATYLALTESSLSNVELVLTILAYTTIFMFAQEILRNKGIYFSKKAEIKERLKAENLKITFDKIITKYLGILFGVGLMLFFYWLIPEYNLGKYVNPIAEAKSIFLPVFLVLSFLLVAFTEFILGPKSDGTFQFGLLMRLKIAEIEWQKFKVGLFEWLVRLIFLTLNFTSSVALINTFRNKDAPLDVFLGNDFIANIIWLESTIFLIILLVILPGYLFSSRLIGTEVKKVDTTWFAWTITLICYQPFIQPIFGNIIKYYPDSTVHGGQAIWVSLTSGSTFLIFVVGILIVFFAIIHLWGEAIMGIRSSNLTNRGIITNGPFAITKHPVYVSKCFGWAFISMPFLNSFDMLDSFRLGLLFLVVCVIFASRGFAEERILSDDENYVEYALEMDKKSLFSFVGKVFPFMTFAWRLNYWKRSGYLKEDNN